MGYSIGSFSLNVLSVYFLSQSMFHRKTDASKIALVHLVATLNYSGFKLLDTQFVTDHLNKFGTIEIPKQDYSILLARAIDEKKEFQFVDEGFGTFEFLLQLTSQTS